jgi:hypothetical protein
MSWLRRAVTGALAGALAVLFIHPDVRPMMLHGLLRYQPSTVVADLVDEQTGSHPLANPKAGLVDADLIEAGATKTPLTQDQALLMAEIAIAESQGEPKNAFWPQMEAVFQEALGHHEASEKAWNDAANRSLWNDYDPARAARRISRLEGETGESLAWHRAVAWEIQPASSLLAIEALTRTLKTKAPEATAKNSALILRNVAPGRRRALYVFGILGGAETRKLIENEPEGMPPLIASFASILSASIPGAFLLTALIGFAIWLLARLGGETQALRWLFSPVYSAPIGTVLGFLLFLATRQPLAAFAVALAFAGFALVQPNKEMPKGVRPNVSGLVVAARSAGVAGALSLTLLLVGLTQSGQAILQLRPDAAFAPIGSPLLAAATLFSLAIAIAAAPAWAHFRRWPAWEAGALALRQFGFAMAVIGAVGAVAAAPICLALDRASTAALESHLFKASN